LRHATSAARSETASGTARGIWRAEDAAEFCAGRVLCQLFVSKLAYSLGPMSIISREMISRGLGFVFAVVAASLGLGSQAHAQSVPYWTSTTGFRSGLTSDPNANPFGNFSSRYNFENGWFVGSERGNLGWGLSNFASPVAFGNGAAFTYEGTQAGYNFKSAPVSVYAGFDTIKYNGPGIGNPFTALDSMSSSNTSGYRVNAGVEFRPTSNLSLSVGASFSQQPNDLNSALLPGASPLAFGRR
jgi:opacity protein-like surface antigen